LTGHGQSRFFAIAKKIPDGPGDLRSLQGFVNRLHGTTLETLHIGAIIDTALATKRITKDEADFVWEFLAGEVKAATPAMMENISSPARAGQRKPGRASQVWGRAPRGEGPRTLKVAPALREHAARRRRVSAPGDPRPAREGGAARDGRRENAQAGGENPEETHISFAAGGPPFDAGSPCPRRWRIEIAHKMERQTEIRTPGCDERVRIFCLVLSLMAHNAWTMMRPDRRARGDGRRVPAASLKTIILLEVCTELGVRPLLRLPRKPSP